MLHRHGRAFRIARRFGWLHSDRSSILIGAARAPLVFVRRITEPTPTHCTVEPLLGTNVVQVRCQVRSLGTNVVPVWNNVVPVWNGSGTNVVPVRKRPDGAQNGSEAISYVRMRGRVHLRGRPRPGEIVTASLACACPSSNVTSCWGSTSAS